MYVQWRGPFQSVCLAGSDHQLPGDAMRPIEHGVHLGRPHMLAILGPAVCQQRQLDQTGIHHGDASEFSAHPLKPRPLSLQGSHPGLDPLPPIPLSHAIGQGVAGHCPAQCRLQTGVFGDGPDQPAQASRCESSDRRPAL
jgi:hypothetical protein